MKTIHNIFISSFSTCRSTCARSLLWYVL